MIYFTLSIPDLLSIISRLLSRQAYQKKAFRTEVRKAHIFIIVHLHTYQSHFYLFCKRIIIPSSRVCKKELFILFFILKCCKDSSFFRTDKIRSEIISIFLVINQYKTSNISGKFKENNQKTYNFVDISLKNL